MLANDPPPGTKVRFLVDIAPAKASQIATLVQRLQPYKKDDPGDRFLIDYVGKNLVVRRDQIEKV